jgi:epoxyqueuosine reductase
VSLFTEQRARLTQSVKDEARRLGFEIVGIARADSPLTDDFARYEAFLDAGHHGDMAYLEADREVRRSLDGPGMLEGARSVVCVARSYKRSDAELDSDRGLASSVAQYARGQDYHNGLRKKLRKLAAYVRGLGDGISARPLIDDAPVLERAWAARAGLGFVGKNGLLIVPGHGSFVLLGEVVTTLELDADDPIPGRCGACTLCLDACPTAAFPSPFVLDARKCIAYLTIEAKSVAPAPLREAIGTHFFGCDVCQRVCPFNRGRSEGNDLRPFRPQAELEALTLDEVLSLDEERFARLKAGSPIGRPGRDGLRRNAAIALGNRGEVGDRLTLQQHRDDPSAEVREAVRWALAMLDEHAT